MSRNCVILWFTVKYVNCLVHMHYYPCNRCQTFIFRVSVHPFPLCTRKIRPGDEATCIFLIHQQISADTRQLADNRQKLRDTKLETSARNTIATRKMTKITTYQCFCIYSRAACGLVELLVSYCCVKYQNVLQLPCSRRFLAL